MTFLSRKTAHAGYGASNPIFAALTNRTPSFLSAETLQDNFVLFCSYKFFLPSDTTIALFTL